MNALSRPLRETPADRRDRQVDYFRRAAERAMRAVDIAGDQLEFANSTGEPGATTAPTLDLARATRALVLAVNAENRVLAGQTAPRAPASDPRRPLLREALHKAADAEPNPKARAALHREVDSRIEDILLADPDAEIDVADHLYALADDLHFAIDPSTLSDEILGIDPTRFHHPPPGEAAEPAHQTRLVTNADDRPDHASPPIRTAPRPDPADPPDL